MACLLIEPWDFSQPLFGNGCRAVVDSAVRILPGKIHLVGATSGNQVIGRWTYASYYGQIFPFLPVITQERLDRPRWPSSNLEFALAVRNHYGAIKASGVRSVLTQTYTILWWLILFQSGWDVCFYYPGLADPLLVGKRRRLGRVLAPLYEAIQHRAISKVTVAFAAASSDVVAAYNDKIHNAGYSISLFPLPTAVNLNLFKPIDKYIARNRLGISNRSPVFVFVGRLAAVKGIPFLVESFVLVLRDHSNALLLIAGEGEERGKIERMVQDKKLHKNVLLLGQCSPEKLVDVISSADACLCGSLAEGFSNAMVEQIACGRPIVTTDVSGAGDLVKDGVNGFIVKERNPRMYSRRMLDVLTLEKGCIYSRKLAEDLFSEQALWATVAEHWPALRTGNRFADPHHTQPTGTLG